jgi:cephalosporin hydroxylase
MKNIIPTRESLDEVEFISKNMDGQTFHHHYHILWDIRNMIDKDEINYFEIGTHSGGSSCLMLRHPKKTNVYSLDLPTSTRHDEVKENVKKFKLNDNTFEYFTGNSRDTQTAKNIRNAIKSVDILFIDGDHTLQAVLDDFIYYKDLVNSGGYVIFDDYHDYEYSPEVKHGVDMIVKEYLFDEYEVLGFMYNKLGAYPKNMIYNNEFVIKKK